MYGESRAFDSEGVWDSDRYEWHVWFPMYVAVAGGCWFYTRVHLQWFHDIFVQLMILQASGDRNVKTKNDA